MTKSQMYKTIWRIADDKGLTDEEKLDSMQEEGFDLEDILDAIIKMPVTA